MSQVGVRAYPRKSSMLKKKLPNIIKFIYRLGYCFKDLIKIMVLIFKICLDIKRFLGYIQTSTRLIL